MPRVAEIVRQTQETRIRLILDLDGDGTMTGSTGVGFFDHMLTHLARHGMFRLTLECQGDLHIDAHHTVEDVGLCLGKALAQALGGKERIRRFGSATIPMDETLATAAVDLSGRPYLVWHAELPNEMLGQFSTALAEEFWRAVSSSAACNLHVAVPYGRNAHHMVEAVFKAVARALREAVEIDPRATGIPSTKGTLSD